MNYISTRGGTTAADHISGAAAIKQGLSEDGAEEDLNDLAHQARLWIQHRTLGPHVREIVLLSAIGPCDCKMHHNR